MSNDRRKTGGFTRVYTLKKGQTPTEHVAYLWQQKKLGDDQLRQLAKDEEVEIRLTDGQANSYPVVTYRSKTGKGDIFSEDDLRRLKEIGLASDEDFARVAVWSDNKAVLGKDATDEFFGSVSHVEAIFANPTPTPTPQPDTPAPAPSKPDTPARDLDTQVLEFLEGLEPEERNRWLEMVSKVVKTMNETIPTVNPMEAWLRNHAKK